MRNLINKFKFMCKEKFNKFYAFIVFVICNILSVYNLPVYAAGVSADTAKTVFDQCIDAVGWIFIGIGFMYGIFGIYRIATGMKEMQSKVTDEGSKGFATGAIIVILGIVIPPLLKAIFTF